MNNTDKEHLDVVTLFSDMFDLSKSESNRLLSSGGLYINNQRIADNRVMSSSDFINGKCFLRKGKKTHAALEITVDGEVKCIEL